jgi:hypothetical protein
VTPAAYPAVLNGLFLLMIFLSGLRVSRSGKPYPVFGFTVHKLAALGGLFILVRTAWLSRPLEPLEWTLLAAAGLFFAALIITGGLLSLERPMPSILKGFHHAAPYLAALSAAGLVYLLFF